MSAVPLRTFDEVEALTWLQAQSRVKISAAELGRTWGWPEHRVRRRNCGVSCGGYFARSPGSEVWVWFGDLPDAIEDALWKKHKRKLMFPAGLEDVPL